MKKCYLCGKKIHFWQKRGHIYRGGLVACHIVCVHSEESRRLRESKERNIISREHNPPQIEFPDLGGAGFDTKKSGTLVTKKMIEDDFKEAE